MDCHPNRHVQFLNCLLEMKHGFALGIFVFLSHYTVITDVIAKYANWGVLWDALVTIRSSRVDIISDLRFGLVGALINCTRFRESHNSLKRSEVQENQSQFKSPWTSEWLKISFLCFSIFQFSRIKHKFGII